MPRFDESTRHFYCYAGACLDFGVYMDAYLPALNAALAEDGITAGLLSPLPADPSDPEARVVIGFSRNGEALPVRQEVFVQHSVYRSSWTETGKGKGVAIHGGSPAEKIASWVADQIVAAKEKGAFFSRLERAVGRRTRPTAEDRAAIAPFVAAAMDALAERGVTDVSVSLHRVLWHDGVKPFVEARFRVRGKGYVLTNIDHHDHKELRVDTFAAEGLPGLSAGGIPEEAASVSSYAVRRALATAEATA